MSGAAIKFTAVTLNKSLLNLIFSQSNIPSSSVLLVKRDYSNAINYNLFTSLQKSLFNQTWMTNNI
jgi:hypothetical protein